MPRKYLLAHGEFEVHYGGMDGICIMPDRLAPEWPEEFIIWIDERIRGQRKLEALVHETVHAARPDLSEEEVTALGASIRMVLWGEGYRHRDEVKP
ncbi:MAG: hypothetical protein AAGI37_18190 [Planctomycetota bacterium]